MSESVSGQIDAPVPVAMDGATASQAMDDTGPAAADADDGGGDGSEPEDGGTAGREPDEDLSGTVPQPASPASASGGASAPVMGDYRMALIAAVNVDLPNQHPTVVLRESESPRRQLSFSIGLQDAVVLTHAMRRIPTPRPLTHELMSQVLQGFDIDVVAVRLVGRQGAIYFAELDLRGRTGRSVHSCRPSDGLTIALLQPVSVPILIDRRLFEVDGDVTPPGPGAQPPE
jgi:uncharacterized protein